MQRRLTSVLALLGGMLFLATGAASGSALSTLPSESEGQNTITVRVVDSRDEADNDPVADVDVEVAKDDGSFEETGTTDADGQAVVEIPANGKYTVELDEDTLPSGAELEDGRSTLEVQILTSGNRAVQFNIGDEAKSGPGLGKQLVNGLTSGVKFGAIIGLAALGLSLIFGTTGLTNFAHGELITLGAVLTLFLNRGLGLPVVVAGFGAVVLAGLFGWGQDRALWRPLRNRGTGLVAMMIVSIGFAILLRYLFQYVIGGRTQPLTQYVTQSRISLGPVSMTPKEIFIVIVSFTVIALTCLVLMKTRLGKATRAVSDNPALAASSGMRVDGVVTTVWILGTGLTGLAGVMLALDQQVMFRMGFNLLLLVFAAVCLGGLGTIWGALLGSLIIGILVEVSPVLGMPAELKPVGALIALILILLLRPQGILGRTERIG
ncbi:hypothetical protein [Aeromicrobium sp. YIM 150415]|uniref:branched-chain amino acid ABC transporter permease n=1 Tax=Aeromicrobium sp. YIM 150415 TaxID=2803912 RepID=UPI001965FE42|nr:hypothetical protein [Aeromicrobium sp. YIM 150415]